MPLVNPMALGLVIAPSGDPEEYLRRVHDLGFSNCFLSLDKYIGSFTPALAKQYRDLLAKYQLTATDRRSSRARNLWYGISFRDPPPSAWFLPRHAPPVSTPFARSPILPSRLALPRCRPIAALFPKIPPIRFIPQPSKPSARSPSTARTTANTSSWRRARRPRPRCYA